MDTKDRESLLGSRFECECGSVHEVPVREVVIEAGAVDRTVEVVRRHELSGPAFLVTDGNTHTILVEQEQVNFRLSDIDTPEGALNK